MAPLPISYLYPLLMLPPPHPTRQGAEQDSSDPGPSQIGGDGRKTWLWEGSTGSSAASVSRCADLKLMRHILEMAVSFLGW